MFSDEDEPNSSVEAKVSRATGSGDDGQGRRLRRPWLGASRGEGIGHSGVQQEKN